MSRLGTLRLALLALAFVGCVNPGPRKAWEKPPPPAHEAAVVEAGAFHRSTLANGVRGRFRPIVLALRSTPLP